MKYLLDTNICIYLINERPKLVFDRFRKEAVGSIGISAVSVAELWFGVAKTGSSRNRIALEGFLLPLDTMPFDQAAAKVYGDIRSSLEKKGSPIGPLDTMIASHAISLETVLVTNNIREFKRVPGLQVENWAA